MTDIWAAAGAILLGFGIGTAILILVVGLLEDEIDVD